ncbi:hypothetical protein B0H14DRAFT_331664 [Mycena olivaceomarginata]|nr:hypothetical protein B0H14DRAFT_331664 [Mycena olivaceomarginata]
MKCIQSPDQHTSNECEQVLCKWIDYRRETTSISGLILNSLSLVLALTEQSANMPEFTSVIEPAIEVLSKILKSFNEGKSTTEGYNTCVQHTINLTGDICATALQSDSNFMQHLKLDFNTYAGLMKKTSQIIEDCNIPRVPADHVQLDLKLDKLNQELESFGARFKTNRLVQCYLTQSTNSNIPDRAHVGVAELEEWLESPPDMKRKQHETEQLCMHGTGQWFMESDNFIEWENYPGVLWIESPSGTGKTVLSSMVIKELFTEEIQLTACPPAVAFFYFDFRKTDPKHRNCTPANCVAAFSPVPSCL